MTLLLVSYPRSGNTYFRNVLKEVYGIESSTYHLESDYPVDRDFDSFQVVKTHLLPEQLPGKLLNRPVVYLVRDGRDCAVSLARYRKDLLEPESDYVSNLEEVIEAAGGSHFGGWSCHVREWTQRADLVLRFEDLIADPIACMEQLRPWLPLPPCKLGKLPTFEDLRTRDFAYGSGVEHGFASEERKRWREGKFRRGKAGGWKDELPADLHMKFLKLHGKALQETEYLEATQPLLPEEELQTLKPSVALTHQVDTSRNHRAKILIDGIKLLDTQVDGISRYVRESILAIHRHVTNQELPWDIDVSLGYLGVVPLGAVVDDLICDQLKNQNDDIHPLFHTGPSNPIVQSQSRIAELKASREPGLIAERMRLKCLRFRRSSLKRWGYLRNFFRQPERGYDLCHLMLPNTWHHYQSIDAPLLMTVHDLSHLACPHLQDESNNKTLARGLAFAGNRDVRFLAVSLSTKRQMTDRLQIPADHIRVVHNGVNAERFQVVTNRSRIEAVKAKYRLPSEPYFLCLGTIEPRKNLINTIRGFRKFLEHHSFAKVNLVLAGGAGWQKIEELQQMITSEFRIHYIGYVDDEDLPALYSSARAVCYASLYEGFGLPILEAMACGAPVIYGDNSSMPEVAKGCGLPVDADDPDSISEAFAHILDNDDLYLELTENAFIRSRLLSWENTARNTMEVYQTLIEEQRTMPRPPKSVAGKRNKRPSIEHYSNDHDEQRICDAT